LGVTFSSVNAWEAGRATPQARHRVRLQQMVGDTGQSPAAVTVLVSDPQPRPRDKCLRVLHDASAALALPIIVHSEPDDVCALVKIGLLRPAIAVFRLPRVAISVEHLLPRLQATSEALDMTFIVMVINATFDLNAYASDRVHIVRGALTLADAGAALRQSAARINRQPSLSRV